MKDAYGNYYNRVQIYLDNETFRQFEALCLKRGNPKSKVGGQIIADYFKDSESQTSQANSEPDRTESLQSQIDELRKMINRLESKLDSSLDAELALTRTESVLANRDIPGHLIEDYTQGLSPMDGKVIHPNQPAPIKKVSEETPDELPLSDQGEPETLTTDIGTFEKENELTQSVMPQSAEMQETKVPNLNLKGAGAKPYIPKDIKKINEAGGIQITDEYQLHLEVLNKYFEPLLKGRSVLKGETEDGKLCWLTGAKHTNITQDYTLARLYHSESRTKLAIPKLEKKFSITITQISAIEFLRGMGIELREEFLKGWGIEFSFIPSQDD